MGHTLRVALLARNATGTGEASSSQTGEVLVKSSSCTVELSSLANVNADLKTAGAVVCLTAGSYGHLELSASPSSNATLTAAQGAHVVVEGIKLKVSEASHLTITQLHLTAALEPWKTNHDKFEYLEITQKSPGEDGFYCWDCKQVELRHSYIHKFESSSGDGDLTHFKEEMNEDVVAENEFSEAWDISGSTGHMDTLQTEGKSGQLAGTLTFEKNYVHDVNTEGTPFVQQENGEPNGEVLVKDNLVLRNNSKACEGTGKTCNSYAGASFYVHDKYNPIRAENNVELETTGGAIEADSGQKVYFNHNVFDLIKRESGAEGANTIAEYNYIANLGGYQWAGGKELDPMGTALPEFKCSPHCGEGHTRANDDYRLKSNPHDIGIDWAPAEQQYGPSN